jgi:hypothetical protein
MASRPIRSRSPASRAIRSATIPRAWTDEYNFGSKEAATQRWKAALDAHADFIATDQYEDVAKFLHGRDGRPRPGVNGHPKKRG